MKLSHSILAAMLALTPLTATAQDTQCDPGETKITMTMTVPLFGHPGGNTSRAMADRINTEMDGRLCMEPLGKQSLDNDDVYVALRNDDIQMALVSLSKFGSITDRYQLFDLPFLFDGPEAVLDFFETDAAQSLKDDLTPAGLVGLGFWSNGMRQISATVPLRVPSDAAGLKFRIQPSAVLAQQFELMGAEPLTVPFAKVHDALRDDEIQGQQNTWSNIYTKEFFLHQNGVTETNHSYVGYMIITSQAFLDSLAPTDRAQYLEIFEQIAHEYNRFSYELNQVSRQDVIDEGSIVRQLTDEERAVWQATFEPLYREFEPIVGTDLLNAARGIDTDSDS